MASLGVFARGYFYNQSRLVRNSTYNAPAPPSRGVAELNAINQRNAIVYWKKRGAGIDNATIASTTPITLTVIDGDGLDRVFHIHWEGNATITNLTVQNGGNVTHGGGIRVSGGGSGGHLNLENVIVRNNTASGNGGGIFVDGIVTLNNVEISDNTTNGTGGGLSNDEQTTLTGVTISGNSAADGGGIYNSNQGNLLELTNVTVSGNTATANGGGIYTAELVKLTNVTLTSNLGGGGIYATGGQGDVQLKNSILANNTGGNSNIPITSLGYNIEDGNSAFTPTTGDQPNTDPLLSPLQNNGGFTQTHALLAGSPAIDPVGLSGAPLHDQRGYARDVTPDIGAFEYNVSNTAPTITSVTGAPMVDEDAVYSLDLTFTDPDDSTVTWTVNWGDGQISSAPSTGATTTLTHTYTQPGFTYNILVSANDGDVTVFQNELLVLGDQLALTTIGLLRSLQITQDLQRRAEISQDRDQPRILGAVGGLARVESLLEVEPGGFELTPVVVETPQVDEARHELALVAR